MNAIFRSVISLFLLVCFWLRSFCLFDIFFEVKTTKWLLPPLGMSERILPGGNEWIWFYFARLDINSGMSFTSFTYIIHSHPCYDVFLPPRHPKKSSLSIHTYITTKSIDVANKCWKKKKHIPCTYIFSKFIDIYI